MNDRRVDSEQQTGEGDAWPGRFAGQVMLATGAAGGLAAATCRRLVKEGATVVCSDRAAVGSGADPSDCLALDVTDPGAWRQVVGEVLAEHGRLDGVLLGHGIVGPVAPLSGVSPTEWRRTLTVNLDGCFFGLAETVPHLRRAGYGRVVALSSIAGREGNPTQLPYAASKGALNALVKSVAKEVAREGVTINAIAPTAMETPMLAELDDAQLSAVMSKVPLGRPGTVTELASLAAWLLSPEASYVTGQVVDLSGGRNTA